MNQKVTAADAFGTLNHTIANMAWLAAQVDTVEGLPIEVAPNPDESHSYETRVVWLVLHSGGYETIWSNNQHYFYGDTSYDSLQDAYDAVVAALDPPTVEELIDAGDMLAKAVVGPFSESTQALERWRNVVNRFNTTR